MPGGYNLWATDRAKNPLYWDRQTPEPLIDEFNAWLNQQPWWQQIRSTTQGDLSSAQRQEIERYLMNQEGLPLSNDFEIDAGGNVNQKGRLKRNLLIGAAIAGGAVTGLGALGIGPLAGAFGGGAAPTLSPATTLAANLGSRSALPAFAAPAGAAPTLSPATTLAANLGSRSALPAFSTPAGAAPTLSPATTLSQNLGPASRLPKAAYPLGGIAAREALPDGRPTQNYPMPKGQKLPTDGTNPFGWATDQLKKNWQDLVKASIPLAVAAQSRPGSGGGNPGGDLPPELQQLLAMSLQRMRDQEPLFQAVNQQAFAGLPAYVKGGR